MPITENGTNAEEDAQYNIDFRENSMLNRIWENFFKNRASAWTAIFTGVLSVFTILLFYVAKNSYEASRMTQRTTASFVGIQPAQKVISPDGKKWMAEQMLIVWVNSGETPARTGLSHSSWESWPNELPQGFNFPDLGDEKPRNFVLSPKGIGSTGMVIPIENFDFVRQGKSHLFLWGWVVYHDIFVGTPKRLTEYCVELTSMKAVKPDITDPTNDLTWQISTCKAHNCYDEDCADYNEGIK